jgi:hypothetical protein
MSQSSGFRETRTRAMSQTGFRMTRSDYRMAYAAVNEVASELRTLRKRHCLLSRASEPKLSSATLARLTKRARVTELTKLARVVLLEAEISQIEEEFLYAKILREPNADHDLGSVEQFVAVWCRSASIWDASRLLNKAPERLAKLASWFRRRGVPLPELRILRTERIEDAYS